MVESVFAARSLDPVDVPEARELATSLGAHGVYVANVLSRDATIGESGEVIALHGRDALLGLLFFGERGNLIVLEREALSPAAVGRAIADSGQPWRIVLGPFDVVEELARAQARAPLVHRWQKYFGLRLAAAPGASDQGVRLAERRDLAMLTAAALDLNHSDLHVDPADVHRGWLKETLRRRIRKAHTWVLAEAGEPLCKLDLGSGGPAGLMLEGVYTVPHARGRGLATRLVAAVAASVGAGYPLVCLHVAADNTPARRAYVRAGMVELGECRLLLRR